MPDILKFYMDLVSGGTPEKQALIHAEYIAEFAAKYTKDNTIIKRLETLKKAKEAGFTDTQAQFMANFFCSETLLNHPRK